MTPLPALIGVVHLGPLPDSPRYQGELSKIVSGCGRDTETLAEAGFDGVIIENYGDAPFYPGRVPAVTVAAMTRCALAARSAAPLLALGINVLRNDAESAIAVAVASGASFVRINVHIGARVTDQGLIEGHAHQTLRQKKRLGAESLRLFCDLDVKHSAPLAGRALAEEAADLVERASADAVLITGSGTGRGANLRDLDEAARAVRAPIYVASGVTESSISDCYRAYGLIVGSCLRADGKAGGPIDLGLARRFADEFKRVRSEAQAYPSSCPPPVS